MGQAAESIVHARAPLRAEPDASAEIRTAPQADAVSLSLHHDLAAIEQEWRAFEQTADCTPFQTFDWLSAWQRHIGTLNRATPAIVIARRGDDIVMLLPLAVQRGALTRRLTFLGQELCDYNVPLLAPEGSFANFKNQDPNLPHSVEVIPDAAPMPVGPVTPAFEHATTGRLDQGFSAGQGGDVRFVPGKAGPFLLL